MVRKVRIASAHEPLHFRKPRIASTDTPTQPSLSESFRTHPNLSEPKPNFFKFSQRPPIHNLFDSRSAVICVYLRFRFPRVLGSLRGLLLDLIRCPLDSRQLPIAPDNSRVT